MSGLSLGSPTASAASTVLASSPVGPVGGGGVTNGVQTDVGQDDHEDDDNDDDPEAAAGGDPDAAPDHDQDDEEGHECTDEYGFGEDDDVAPASMWTKVELKEFKDSIRKEGGDSIIKVGHGETVTVRVPTHKDGSALFWEFATDSYDIAFGLFFEWTETDENEVSVHISDSEDEDLDDDYNGKIQVDLGHLGLF